MKSMNSLNCIINNFNSQVDEVDNQILALETKLAEVNATTEQE
jgi:prefoldin subunit 5